MPVEQTQPPPPPPKQNVGMMFINEAVQDGALMLLNPGMLGVKLAGEVTLMTAGKLTRTGTKVGMGIATRGAGRGVAGGAAAATEGASVSSKVGTAVTKMAPKTTKAVRAVGSAAGEFVEGAGARVKQVVAKYPKTTSGAKKLFKIAKTIGKIYGEVREFEERLLDNSLDNENLVFLGDVGSRDKGAYDAALTIKADSMGVSPSELKATVDQWLSNNYDPNRGISSPFNPSSQIFEDAAVPSTSPFTGADLAAADPRAFCELHPLHPRCGRMGTVGRMRSK